MRSCLSMRFGVSVIVQSTNKAQLVEEGPFYLRRTYSLDFHHKHEINVMPQIIFTFLFSILFVGALSLNR